MDIFSRHQKERHVEHGITRNLARWEEVVPVHMASESYRVKAVLAGEPSLSRLELSLLGDVRGATVLNLMGHIGLDAITISRLGAQVTLLDFSPSAIAAAQRFAKFTGVAIQTCCSDIRDSRWLGEFDIVFANWGTLVWIEDIDSMFRTAAEALGEAGRLIIIDQHPVLLSSRSTLSGDPGGSHDSRYFAHPERELRRRDYADHEATITNSLVTEYHYTLGEILSAAANHMTIKSVREYPYLGWPGVVGMKSTEERLWELKDTRLPLSFSLECSKKPKIISPA